MGFFHNLSINAGIYPIYIQWELNTCPTSYATVIEVWISLVWVDRHHERKKRPDLLWDSVSGSLTLVFFPYSSRRPESFKINTAWSDLSMVWPRKLKSLLIPFSTRVLTGTPILTKRAKRDPNFVAHSPPPLEMAWIFEL